MDMRMHASSGMVHAYARVSYVAMPMPMPMPVPVPMPMLVPHAHAPCPMPYPHPHARSAEDPERGAALGRVASLEEMTDPAHHSERQWEICSWLQAAQTHATCTDVARVLTPTARLPAHPSVRPSFLAPV